MDLVGEAELVVLEVQQDDVVGLQPLRLVYGKELDVQFGDGEVLQLFLLVLVRNLEKAGFLEHVPVVVGPAQEQYRGLGPEFRDNLLDGLAQRLAGVAPIPPEYKGIVQGLVRAQVLLELERVLEDESGGFVYELL